MRTITAETGVTMLKRFFNHRGVLMGGFGAHASAKNWAQLEGMKRQLAMAPPKTDAAFCKYVAAHEEDIRALLPGATSKFQKQAERIMELVEGCKGNLKI